MKIIRVRMMRRTARTLLFYVLMLTAPSTRGATAEAAGTPHECDAALVANEETAPIPENTPDRWQFDASTSAWFPVSFTMRADTAVGAFSQRLGLTQVIGMYRGGGLAHFNARKGNFGLFLDLNYGNLVAHSGTASYGPPLALGVNFPVKDELQCGILQIGGMYHFGTDRFSLDGLAGVRYLYAKIRFSTWEAHVNTNKDFIEPMIGGNLALRLLDTWTLSARTSISGFGLGSELTTDSEARISHKLSNRVSCYFGYRILDTNYHQKAGNLVKLSVLNDPIPLFTYKDFNADIKCTAQGPVAGVELRW